MAETRPTTWVRVLLFSVLREKVGAAEVTVALDGPVPGGELLDRLAAEHPAVADYRGVLRLAVNQEYVGEDVVVAEGDEVALITPVSGG